MEKLIVITTIVLALSGIMYYMVKNTILKK
jgi:hypothetical protein